MEFDEFQALVHLLWLGASVDKKIADSEREYIQKVCSHEKIPLKLEELEKHHENNQFDQIYQEWLFFIKIDKNYQDFNGSASYVCLLCKFSFFSHFSF